MTLSDQPAELLMSISAVERDTGITKDTLRVWERRYGFPNPMRDASGERAYSVADVQKLRLLRRLLDAGHRPGRIIGDSCERLRALAEQISPPRIESAFSADAGRQHLYALVQARRPHELHAALTRDLTRLGLERFVIGEVAGLCRMVGDGWARGELGILEEHLFSEILQGVMRDAIARLHAVEGGPRVLLTTLPGEQHGLGLLMAESIFALEGCTCISLGVQTPVAELARAADEVSADIVGVSCSGHATVNAVTEALTELRARLPRPVELWVGGESQITRRRPMPGIHSVPDLDRVAGEISRWRQSRKRTA